MSFYLKSLLAAGLAVVAAGCASPKPVGNLHAACSDELDRYRSAKAEEFETLAARLKQVSDEAQTQIREVRRARREASAVRASYRAERASLDEALSRLTKAEQALAAIKTEQAASPEGGGAAKLIRDLARQNEKLKAELAAERAGERKPGPDLSGLIRPSHLDLEVPVAWVDREPLRRRDFVEFLYRDVGASGFLDLYIHRHLILREAKRRGLDVSDVDVALWISNQLVTQAKEAGSSEKLTADLAKKGFTHKAWEARLRFQARAAIQVARLVAIGRDTPSGRDAWEARLRESYHEAYSERLHARHIFIRLHGRAGVGEAKAAARKIQRATRELERGIPFETVALRHSEDDKSRELGGALGAFDRTRFAQLPNLNTVLFAIETGKISKPVRSAIGLHIVRVDSKEPAARSFAEARPNLEKRLRKEPPAEAEVTALIRRLRAQAQIKTNLVFDDD